MLISVLELRFCSGAPICSPWTFRENHSPCIQRVKTPGYTLQASPFWFSFKNILCTSREDTKGTAEAVGVGGPGLDV